jgi:A/G-specific adenine glycosylase
MTEFSETVWDHYHAHGRTMPWREDTSFYAVLVSEIMLQQTQVPRVLPKFAEFMAAFPTIQSLAAASLADVLRAWQGLGYNRRAKYLHEAAKIALQAGIPDTMQGLVALPGVGYNTAAAIMNYVYEIPTAYVETNIRTVYFHHFFAGRADVSDAEVLALVDETMDREHPREWFWALMDYGAQLKSEGLGRLDTSKHYKKQSPLAGSVREVRGQIIRALTSRELSEAALREKVVADARFGRALAGLIADGLVTGTDGQWSC